ncbi:aminotransferase class V-fold PLP-dependent enzyme [Candidatus Peregrinibacteria bacterium]|nr:MAG: aminotransferase class V-fold PLP-dependent enzyme [Candidatus Peregrinibacteria bacterium]
MKHFFPIFTQRPDLIYFDNAATAQKPQAVLDAIQNYYTYSNSNIHRGPNFLAEEATVLYNEARRTVADFIGARESFEVIFTRNATESINLVARSLELMFNPGDTIVLSQLEHHSNIVPWLQLKERRGIQLKYIPVNKEGRLDFDPALLDESVKLVAVTGMSNALGTITNLKPIIEAAHRVGAKVLVDGSQLVVHEPVNVQALDCDFFVFTGHKLYGPTGIGVLYGKKELLESMPPFLGGGDMINEVTEQSFSPAFTRTIRGGHA